MIIINTKLAIILLMVFPFHYVDNSQKSLLSSLISSIESIRNTNLILQKIDKEYNINKYIMIQDLLGLSDTARSITICAEKNMFPLVSKDGKYRSPNSLNIYMITMQNSASAMRTFNRIHSGLKTGDLRGKTLFKAGGVVLIEENKLFLIPIFSCSSTNDFDIMVKKCGTYYSGKIMKIACGGRLR